MDSSTMLVTLPSAALTQIYTLSLHDALPISNAVKGAFFYRTDVHAEQQTSRPSHPALSSTEPVQEQEQNTWSFALRSEEHTSELQSRLQLVCRLLLEKKK